MPRARREQKVEQVDLLIEKLKKAKVAVLTDYRGLKVNQIQELRGKLRTANVEYRVVKNTLARRAAESAGYKALESELKGPIAIAFGYDDLSLPPRLINCVLNLMRQRLTRAPVVVFTQVTGRRNCGGCETKRLERSAPPVAGSRLPST